MSVRKIIFWLHLTAGLVAGVIIAVMSATGVALAFEKEIVAWAERDVRRVTPASWEPLPLDELLAKARAAAPADAKLSAITASRDPGAAVAVHFAREAGVYYINPYTGAVARPASTRTAAFMRTLVEWHRYLGQSGDNRPAGKAVTGAANLAFLFLAVSGLWLWWPRAWNARLLRPSLWFVRGATGRTRDWNWHNVVGFWSLPVLVVLTASGAVIGYAWANNLVYRAAGEKPQKPGALAPSAVIPPPATPPPPPPPLSASLARLQNDVPGWQQITVREGFARRPNPAPAIEPHTATVHTAGEPSFAPAQLVLDPHTGATVADIRHSDQTAGRKARTWLRYLHTGQALGWPGQLVAGLASLGALVLVYTGFALAFRRLFGRSA